MAPEPGNPLEVEGVLNPAGTVGPEGRYYLFPRMVAMGNYSRIGIARVQRNAEGRPLAAERLGIALEPEAPYELGRGGVAGCEDPRVSYLPFAGLYVMAYTALGPRGPHIALASSRDLHTWQRLGLVDFAHERDTDFNAYQNKDAIVLPEPVFQPDGKPAIALLHRPMYDTWDDEMRCRTLPPPIGVQEERPSIWISYCPLEQVDWLSGTEPPRFAQHHLLARPEKLWEAYRIGGGTVPLRTPHGWLMFYHGVALLPDGGRRYQTGALLLDERDPRRILARSRRPIFSPQTVDERRGMVSNVVFPTALDQHAGRLDVYYGMADSRIGVARLTPRAAYAQERAA